MQVLPRLFCLPAHQHASVGPVRLG
jgi:hypothetical protein